QGARDPDLLPQAGRRAREQPHAPRWPAIQFFQPGEHLFGVLRYRGAPGTVQSYSLLVEVVAQLLGSDQVVVLSRVAAPIDVQIQAGDGGAVRAPLRELPQEIPVDDLWHGTILSFPSGIPPS